MLDLVLVLEACDATVRASDPGPIDALRARPIARAAEGTIGGTVPTPGGVVRVLTNAAASYCFVWGTVEDRGSGEPAVWKDFAPIVSDWRKDRLTSPDAIDLTDPTVPGMAVVECRDDRAILTRVEPTHRMFRLVLDADGQPVDTEPYSADNWPLHEARFQIESVPLSRAEACQGETD